MSDIIQLLSDRDSSLWAGLVGFVPDDVTREASNANRADLLLSAGERRAVIEVKLGHIMSPEQQGKYEALHPRHDLYLAALEADRHREQFVEPLHVCGTCGCLGYTSASKVPPTAVNGAEADARTDAMQSN